MIRPKLLHLACILAALAPAARAADDLRIPSVGKAPALDGRVEEGPWASAARLRVESVEVPAAPPAGGTATTRASE